MILQEVLTVSYCWDSEIDKLEHPSSLRVVHLRYYTAGSSAATKTAKQHEVSEASSARSSAARRSSGGADAAARQRSGASIAAT